MLVALRIRDFVLVDRLTLELGRGFTVLTGETGAGKSILLDALALILGERADPEAIRQGAPRAEFEAHFDVSPVSPARPVVARPVPPRPPRCRCPPRQKSG